MPGSDTALDKAISPHDLGITVLDVQEHAQRNMEPFCVTYREPLSKLIDRIVASKQISPSYRGKSPICHKTLTLSNPFNNKASIPGSVWVYVYLV